MRYDRISHPIMEALMLLINITSHILLIHTAVMNEVREGFFNYCITELLERGICYDFQRGSCYRGRDCRYAHEIIPNQPMFNRGGRSDERGYRNRKRRYRPYPRKRRRDIRDFTPQQTRDARHMSDSGETMERSERGEDPRFNRNRADSDEEV